jgi:hypothetical protein
MWNGADNELLESKSRRPAPFSLTISIKNYSIAGLIGITESLFLVDEEQNPTWGDHIHSLFFNFVLLFICYFTCV